MTTGGNGGGGMCEGLLCPFVVFGSYCCCPGAPAKIGGGGKDMEEEGSNFISVMANSTDEVVCLQ